MYTQSACSPVHLRFPDQNVSDPSLSQWSHPIESLSRWLNLWMVVSLTVLLLAGSTGAFAQAPILQPAWNQQSPSSYPPARYLHALTYDASHGQVVLFGGIAASGSPLSDTWLWNGTAWTQANPTNSPTARDAFAMTYDATQGNVVLFGGRLSASTWTNDTWVWNGSNWTNANPATSPSPRSNMTMVYDAAHGNDVMFGGVGAASDTWIWNGTTWTLATPTTSPSARYAYSMVYDAATGNVVLFGGTDASGNEVNDTWIWNGTTWSQVIPANSPSARDGQGMAYDAALGEVVMFGGIDSSGNYLNDTWLWNGSNWTQQSLGVSPPAREVPNALAYDAALGQMIMFGGFYDESVTTTFSDTWEFGTPQNFGSINVCPGGQTTPAPCSNTLTLTYDISTTTTFGTTAVVTQGATGRDFSLAAGGSCAGTVNADSSCTVNVTFAPQAPGLREGAVELFDNSGNLLASTPIYGIGEAPEIAFGPAATNSASGLEAPVPFTAGTLSGPGGMTTDAAGNLYVTNYVAGGANVLELAPDGTETTITGFSDPVSVAIDGAGNLYVADTGLNSPNGAVMKVPYGCTTSACQIQLYAPITHPAPFGVAVDGLGDVFIADDPAGIIEFPAGCTSSSCSVNVGSGWSQPEDVAVDAAGDLFVADSGLKEIVEIPAGCTSSSCQTTVGSGWVYPQSLAVDAAGDVIVADAGLNSGNGEVIEVPAGCTSSCQVSLFSGISYGVAVNAAGEIFIADQSADEVLQVNQAQPPAEDFPDTAVGATSDLSFTVLNVGNQTLISNPAIIPSPFKQYGVNGNPPDCTDEGGNIELPPGQRCNLSIAFLPEVAASYGAETGVFQDTSLNGSYSDQYFSLSGTGVAQASNYGLTVMEAGSGSGTVTDDLDEISCSQSNGNNSGGPCLASYLSGTQVTLSAAASGGSTFAGWGGACASYGTSSQCQVTMNAAESVTAAFNPLTLGSANVCAGGVAAGCTASTLPVVVNLPTSATVSSINVVTQGASNLDFTLGVGSGCAGFVGPGTCIVNVDFAPLAPGLRMGAVELLDSGGNVLATQLISGVGQAPEAAFGPAATYVTLSSTASTVVYSSQVSTLSNLSYAGAMTTDAAGNLYAASGSGLMELTPPYNGTPTTLATGFYYPTGLAIDGAGNFYVADGGLGEVVELAPACTSTGASCASVVYSASGVYGVAVDASGDVFVTNSTYGAPGAVEILANGGGQATLYNTGYSDTAGIALDAAGNVYLADYGVSRVVKIPAGCTSNCTATPVGSGWNQPYGVAIDPAGDLLVADTGITVGNVSGNGGVVEVPASCANNASSCQFLLWVESGVAANALAVSGTGQLFLADTSGAAYEVSQSQPPSLSFGSIDEGSSSATQTITMQNIGNQPLGAISPGLAESDPDFGIAAPQGACPSNFSLAAGATCTLNYYLAPVNSGPLSGTAYIDDNALNNSSTFPTQSIGLTGTGVPGTTDYTLTVADIGSGSGIVMDNDDLITCNETNGSTSGLCSGNYPSGQSVTLSATAITGSTFAGWGGACASYGTSSQCQVTMNAAESVTATFNPLDFAFTAPTSPVNTATGVQTATVNLVNGGTPATISVVTQGATGKDFNFAAGGTCAVGTPYTAAQTCTINYTFTPLAPGRRNGAVVLTDASGNVLGTTYLSGIGTGPQGLFDTTPQTLSISSLNIVRGLSLDDNGNLYALEQSGSIDEFPAGSSTKIQLATIPVTGGGTAVDGAGNLWVATTIGNLYELAGGTGPAVQVATIPDADDNLMFDGAGNLYFTGYYGNVGAIFEIPAGTTQVNTLVPGNLGQRFIGMAIDAAGNLFAADYNNSVLYELPAGTTSLVTLASGGYLSNPHGVAVDPAGNVYVTNANGSSVIRYAAGTYTATLLPEQGLRGITLDSAGNMYTITSDSTIAGYTRTQASPLTFANTTVGNTSDSQQGDLFENDGNAPLVITGYSATAPFALGGTQDTCGGISTLAAGASCVVGATFTPTAASTVGGTATITDNTLNITGTAQTISLSGTGMASSYPLTLTPIGSGSGTVTDNSSAISCSGSNGSATGTCSSNYQSGASVILTANPAPGSIFLGWGGACGGFAPTCEITMIQAYNVTASFAQQNFGSINVCQPGQSTPAPCSTGIPVTINIPTTTTIGAIQVVTQGVSGLDFSQGSGGTCTGTIPGGTACTVNVNFTPLAAGLRRGAVELYDNNGNVIVTTPVYGIGQAPVAAFGPGTQITVASGVTDPYSITEDAAGNLFIATWANGQVVKIAAGGTQTTLASGLGTVEGVAVDGAGNVYAAEQSNNIVIEIPAGGGQPITLGSGLHAPSGVAVDGAGNVFIADYLNNRVVEVPAGGGPQTTVGSGLSVPQGVAVDGLGDVIIADSGANQIVMVTASGVQTTLPFTGLDDPIGVAVDAAGDVFATNYYIGNVMELTPEGVQTILPVTGVGTPGVLGVGVDAGGDVFLADLSKVVVMDRSLPPSFNFALTNVGNTSADSPQIATLQNVGNQPLTGSATFNIGQSFSVASTCNPSFTLLPGATCSENFGFSPQSTGYQMGSAAFSDNTLNLSTSVSLQTINLSGQGGINGQPVGVQVPNVVGLAQAAASSSITGTGLMMGTVSTASSNVVPSGSVIASNPAAGTVVNPGSSVGLLVSTGQAVPPSPNPLSLLNNYFVTGDYAAAGVTLRGSGAGNPATGTITIPDSTTSPGTQGVPDGADIVDGYLYWMTLETSALPSGNVGTFLGYSITGQQIGSDIAFTDGASAGTLRVYRADVNTYFPVDSNGSGVRTGSGAFTVSFTNSGGTLTEGASLVVIYRVLSPNFPLKSVVIYDGSAVPTTSTDQNVQGFYDALGGATGESTTLSYGSGSWNSSVTSVSMAAHASQYSAPMNTGTAYAAEILSTPVTNSDNDGILDAWKAGPAAGDFYAGQPGYYDVKTGQWVPLPGALHGEKDLFVQLDYMCGAVLADGSCDPSQENLFPAPDANGNDPLAMVKNAFTADGIVLHLEIGNAVAESTCTDNTSTNPPQLCQFPNEPGVIGWKNSLEFSKVWPKNLASCAAGGDCSPRFPYGQKDSYHYVLFGHSLAIPAWNSRYQTLTGISVSGGVTTITTTNRGAEGSINYCPSRITISGVLGNPSLNGVYNTTSCADSQHITVATPGVSNWTYPNTTMPEPEIGLTFGTVTSISGYSDLGGSDSAITLGLWETDPNQDMSKRANVIAGTLFHEIGHTLGLTHGGLYYDNYPSYVPTFEENCKPNFQSSMNYLFQLDGVGPTSAVAYSNQVLETLASPSLASVTSLSAGSVAATFPTSAWYTPTAPSSTATPATLHCDGTPLTGDTGYRVDGPIAPVTPPWSNGQNITFDGVPPNGSIPYDPLPYSTLRGYSDVANLDLRQVGASGGEFASFASAMPFGSTASPLTIAPGGSVSVTAGGTIALGSGGTVALGSGGTVTLGSGGTIALGSGGSVTLNQGGTVTLGSGGTVTLGSGGTVALGSGGTVTLGSGGTITLGSGGTVALGSGGTVTLGSGGTIALGSGGSVTIPSTGGSYTLPNSGGTVTLGSGGTVALGSGGTVTLGSGGTIAMGSGGTVALGSGGTVTLGSGGTITMGSGGTVALGSGGTVTLGSGGTITMGSGGTVTLGSGGTVTLGSGGTVTMGSGGTIALGSGGTVTLGSGGTVALGSGGTVALGSGGTVTLGSGGTIAMGSGGTVALGSGGTVTLGNGGTIALGSGGTITLGSGGTVTLGSGGTITLGSGGTPTTVGAGTYTLGSGGTVTLGSGGTVALGSGGTVTLGSGGTITLGSGGTVALGSGGTVTLGSGGTITMGSGGTVTLGSGGTVTLGSGGTVALGSGGTVALGSGGTIALGSGGTVTLGSGGASSTELDYNTANSVVRPPISPTYMVLQGGSVQVSWMAPAFGVVQTYTISRSVNGGPPVVIGSVSGVNGNAPATTFTDTTPPVGTLVYTISTTLVPDTTNSTPRQSGPSTPAVLTVNQTIVLGSLPSSVSLSGPPVTVTATAQSNGVANGLLVSFGATGSCSAGSPAINTTTGVSSAMVTLNSTGSCTITASQAGDSTTAAPGGTAYNAASPVSATFTILPPGSTTQSQTISFGPLPNVEYGSAFSVSATASSGMPVSFSAPTSGSCTVSAATGTAIGAAIGAGRCTITASAPAGNNYSAATVSASFYVFPAPLAVSAINLTSVYGQPLPSLTPVLNVTYSLTGFVNGDTAAAISGAPALSTTAIPGNNAGSYPITVSTGTLAAANYSFLYVPGTLTIVQPSTTTSISSSTGGTSNYGQLVTITPTVTGTPAPPATDYVFYSYTNSTINGGSPVYLGGVPLGNGGYSTFLLPPGTNTITATFNSDPNPADTGFVPDPEYQSSSASVKQVVASVPVAYISPASVNFPNTDVGSTSASISVTLTNIGTAPLNISGAQIVSGDSGPADFVVQSSSCGSVLQAGPMPPGPPAWAWGNAVPPPAPPVLGKTSTVSADSSCSVTLAFAPNPKQGEGVRTGTLVFSDNDGGLAGASDYIALTGSALSSISGSFPMPPMQTIAAGNYIWFNSELSVQGPLDPNGNPLNMNKDEVQVMVTNGSIAFTNPATGTTATIPVPDALIQFVPGLTQATTTFDAANNRWVTQVPMADPATGRSQFVIPGNIFATAVPYLVPATISQALHGASGAQNVVWSAEFTTDTPGVSFNWQWGAAAYNSCFGNQPTSSNPTCAGDSLNLANLDVLGVNSADPGKCPIANTNNYDAGTPYGFITDLLSSGPPSRQGGPPNLYTGNPSPMAGVVPAVTPVSFSPSPLVFMPVTAGQSSSPMTITITNDNESLPFNISGVTVTGSNPADFAITGTTCTNANGPASVSANSVGALTLAPAAGGGANSCTLTVVFTPGDLGTRTSSLVFTYATPAGMAPNETPPPQKVDLYGTGAGGTNPIVGLSAMSLNFPHQEQGTNSAIQTVMLVNAGGGALTINSIAPSGQFGETNTCPTYPNTLASGGTCTISVWFQPLATAIGTETGAITITDNNAGVSGSAQTISLSGQASP